MKGWNKQRNEFGCRLSYYACLQAQPFTNFFTFHQGGIKQLSEIRRWIIKEHGLSMDFFSFSFHSWWEFPYTAVSHMLFSMIWDWQINVLINSIEEKFFLRILSSFFSAVMWRYTYTQQPLSCNHPVSLSCNSSNVTARTGSLKTGKRSDNMFPIINCSVSVSTVASDYSSWLTRLEADVVFCCCSQSASRICELCILRCFFA